MSSQTFDFIFSESHERSHLIRVNHCVLCKVIKLGLCFLFDDWHYSCQVCKGNGWSSRTVFEERDQESKISVKFRGIFLVTNNYIIFIYNKYKTITSAFIYGLNCPRDIYVVH